MVLLAIGILGFIGLFALNMHHVMKTGVISKNDEVLYDKTIVSKAYSTILPTMGNRKLCPRTGKQHCYNDHLGCAHFQGLNDKKNKVICSYHDSGLSDAAKGGNGKSSKEIDLEKYATVTGIGKLTYILHKHQKLTFDAKLAKHLKIKPVLLDQYLKTLERYKFVNTYMDPIHGMIIEWVDNSDRVYNGYSKEFIRDELQKRRNSIII
ncbi:MAG: hypothetical protein GF416_08295 [Candidatus Altiarchaeales archaeon]|nr:hypothetical protein [Candidatus Altiarchaeales archaeon]MBD3417115.1 hypothetical protein [Candidatus Altiarchaeales archaeon]